MQGLSLPGDGVIIVTPGTTNNDAFLQQYFPARQFRAAPMTIRTSGEKIGNNNNKSENQKDQQPQSTREIPNLTNGGKYPPTTQTTQHLTVKEDSPRHRRKKSLPTNFPKVISSAIFKKGGGNDKLNKTFSDFDAEMKKEKKQKPNRPQSLRIKNKARGRIDDSDFGVPKDGLPLKKRSASTADKDKGGNDTIERIPTETGDNSVSKDEATNKKK